MSELENLVEATEVANALMEEGPKVIIDEERGDKIPEVSFEKELEKEITLSLDSGNKEEEMKLRADKTFKGKVTAVELMKLKDAKKNLAEFEKNRAEEPVLVITVEVLNAPEVGKIMVGKEIQNWSFRDRPFRIPDTLNPKSNIYKLINKYIGLDELKKYIMELNAKGLGFSKKRLIAFISQKLKEKEVIVVTDSKGYGHIKLD
jgi:hypothetical protein